MRQTILRALCGSVIFGIAAGCGSGAPSGASHDPPTPPTSSTPTSWTVGPDGAVRPNSPAIRYLGRFDSSDPSAPEFAWPASTIALRFTGSSISVTLTQNDDGWDDSTGNRMQNEYDVFLDGVLQPDPLTTSPGTATYAIASGLSSALHELRLVKRTEAATGSARFLGFVVDPGATIEQPPAAERRLEFIGDSITAGYGVLGADQTCSFSAQTEDVDASYAIQTANALNAEAVVEAYQGKGVLLNHDPADRDAMPVIYPRIVPDLPSPTWSPSDWRPQAIVIDLGTNDFTDGDPGEGFVTAMEGLVGTIRAEYPDALIVLALGPMLGDDYPVGQQQLSTARGYLQTVVADEAGQGDARVAMIEFPEQDGSLGYGCDWHPSRQTQAAMAQQLGAFLSSKLGW